MKKGAVNTNDKNKKLLKKRRARLRRIRKFLTFALLVTGIILFARSSFFIVEKIDVTGNKKYTADGIIAQSGLTAGKNVFMMLGEKRRDFLKFRFHEQETRVNETMSYIKSISIRPSLPKSISIKVVERTPFCILEEDGTSLLIDDELYVLEKVENPEIKNKYFKINGAGMKSFTLGKKLEIQSEDLFNMVKEFNQLLIKNDSSSDIKLFQKITSFNLEEINSIIVTFDQRITVKFGDMEDMNYKIDYFKQLFVNNISESQKGTLDFTKSKNPFFSPERGKK